MSDLISRGKLFNLLAPVQTLGEAYGIIQGMETVDAVPVRHGRWIRGKCDQCGCHAPFWCMASTYYKSGFCPDCGARMDGKGNGNETD